jgi:hypothetical protein
MRILGLGLVLILCACSAPQGGQQTDREQVARIQAMQEHLESLRARGAIPPDKYEASKTQLDAELRRAQAQ